MEHWRDLELPRNWSFVHEDGREYTLVLEWEHGLGDVCETEILRAPAERWRRLALDILREVEDTDRKQGFWNRILGRDKRERIGSLVIRVLE